MVTDPSNGEWTTELDNGVGLGNKWELVNRWQQEMAKEDEGWEPEVKMQAAVDGIRLVVYGQRLTVAGKGGVGQLKD